MPASHEDQKVYLRNFVFGVEDSLVSTVGLLSGVASAGVETRTIILTGVVLIIVEALSMAVGSYLSEYSVEEYERQTSPMRLIGGGITMFLSYAVAGLIPLAPYALGFQSAFMVSIILSVIALFLLGIVSARFGGVSPLSRGVRMVVAGGVAIATGTFVGSLFR